MLLTRPVAAALGLSAIAASGCGARTGLHAELAAKDAAPEADAELEAAPGCDGGPDCGVVEAGCDGAGCSCLEKGPGACDDDDPCTDDACDALTGACLHAPRTPDDDGDGHRAPLPGTTAGAPGSCGDDCDDADPDNFPGNVEVCDRRDNDCNGVVDDGFGYVPADPKSALRVSTDAVSAAEPSGLACDGTRYLAYYEAEPDTTVRTWTALVSSVPEIVGPEAAVTPSKADNHGGTIHGRQAVWTGDRYGLAWNDTRDGNYEIYFAALDADRQKIAPGDVRVTNDPALSFNPTLAWSGSEFLVVWEEDQIRGQRLALDGTLVGGPVDITHDTLATDHEGPFIAVGDHGVGLAYASADRIYFVSLGFDLVPTGKAVELTGGLSAGAFPRVEYNRPNYVVAWYDALSPKRAIWATVRDESGAEVVAPTQVTESPRHSRHPAILPLGDKLVLVWADDKDQNLGYEIYLKMLSPLLVPLGPELRVTDAIGDSIYPIASFGPAGEAAVFFRDERLSSQQVYLTKLLCTK